MCSVIGGRDTRVLSHPHPPSPTQACQGSFRPPPLLASCREGWECSHVSLVVIPPGIRLGCLRALSYGPVTSTSSYLIGWRWPMCKQLMRVIMSAWQAMSLALSLPPLGSLLSMVRPHHLQDHLTTALTAVLSHCAHSSELSLVPTAVVHPGGVVMVAEGSDLTLNCSASGRSTPATYWLRDSQLLRESPRLSLHRLPGSSLLVVRSVNMADGGTYLCYGNNSVGTDTETVAVTVLVRPTLSVVPFNVTARAREGVNQSVVCEAQGVPPPVVVILDPQGSIVAESGVWTPPTPLTRDIGGTYQCVAINQVGQVNISFLFLVEGELGAQSISEWEAEMSQLPSLPSVVQMFRSSPPLPRTSLSSLERRLYCAVLLRVCHYRRWSGAGWTTPHCPPTMSLLGTTSNSTASPCRTVGATNALLQTLLGQMWLSPGSVWWVSQGMDLGRERGTSLLVSYPFPVIHSHPNVKPVRICPFLGFA